MYLKMKPVCDCGHVFDELEITPHDENKLAYYIHPSCCPDCEKGIDGLTYHQPNPNLDG